MNVSPRSSPHPRPRRTRSDWIDIALSYGGSVGFEQLAIEPLAAHAGATKGSLYWHFADRAALLDAVLETWEQRACTDFTTSIDPRNPDAITTVVTRIVGHPYGDIERRMLLGSADPQIGPTVDRVHAARLAFLEEALLARGTSPYTAHTKAHLIYAAYLGGLILNGDPAVLRAAILSALTDIGH